jgi:hypothetical protein
MTVARKARKKKNNHQGPMCQHPADQRKYLSESRPDDKGICHPIYQCLVCEHPIGGYDEDYSPKPMRKPLVEGIHEHNPPEEFD